MNRPYSTHGGLRSPKRERGVVMVVVTIGLIAILAMSGLAMDSGHMMLTKTRLQNAVDAAALSAAKTLSSTGDTGAATAMAQAVFGDNAAAPGNGEINSAWNDGNGEITLNVEFSATLDPFTAAGTPPYVRVTATGLTLNSFLVQLVGIDDKSVNASAVAGPSGGLTGLCDIVPMMACGCDPATDASCCDPTSDPDCSSDTYFESSYPSTTDVENMTFDDITAVKISANVDETLGSGNFQLLRLGDNQGSNYIRNALAGNYDGLGLCADVDDSGDEWVDPEPGNKVNAVATGLNSRFDGSNSLGVDADYVKTEILEGIGDALVLNGDGSISTESGDIPDDSDLYGYHDYSGDTGSTGCSGPEGCEEWRRMMVLPVGYCNGLANGASNPIQVHGYACFMLLQRVVHTGTEAYVFGQFVPTDAALGGCFAPGGISPNPSDYAPTKIVLYRNPDSGDS